MKYLKKFNESNSDREEEIKKFCEENLAYLIDAGFNLRYRDYPDYEIADHENIELTIDLVKDTTFKWDEIVNDFVPFLQILDDKYGLVKLKPTSKRDKYSKKCSIVFNESNFVYRYTLDDLVNDRTDGISEKNLQFVEFSVKK